MTATHNPPRRTRTRPQRRHRLSRIHWGWYPTAIIVFAASAKAWPAPTIGVSTLLATALIVAAIRPARLGRLWHSLDRIADHRRALPPSTRGHRTLNTFLHMHHDRFEHAIADLAREHPDVRTATKCGKSADRGVDVLVHLHNGARILIQCKHYAPGRKNVGGPAVREIVGSVIASRCHAGAIVTTSDFTPEAYDTNHDLGRNGLALVNGQALVQWANGGRPPWQ